jgi:hypothetical protein
MSTEASKDELLAGLTEEERALLEANDDEGGGNEQDDAGGDENDGAAAAGDEPGTGDDNEAGAADAGDGGKGGDDGADEQEGQAKPDAQRAPLLVAEAPEDAQAKLTEIANQKAELRKQYDDGELTFDEYEAKKDELDDQRLEIRQAVAEAQIASKLEAQRARNEFLDYAKRFTSEVHPEYAKNQDLYQLLDKTVIELANLPSNAGLTGQQVLEKAHKLVMIDHPDKFAAPAPNANANGKKQAAVPKPNLPPNLSKLPAATGTEAGESRFAALDRLAETDGIAFERALAAIPEAERDAYLRA